MFGFKVFAEHAKDTDLRDLFDLVGEVHGVHEILFFSENWERPESAIYLKISYPNRKWSCIGGRGQPIAVHCKHLSQSISIRARGSNSQFLFNILYFWLSMCLIFFHLNDGYNGTNNKGISPAKFYMNLVWLIYGNMWDHKCVCFFAPIVIIKCFLRLSTLFLPLPGLYMNKL